jgi:hypothetical protein
VVVLRGRRCDASGVDHWCRLERESDAVPIADVFTLRRFSR